MTGVAKVPCGSCPYRKDVPSGIWHPDEYRKLIEYDRDTGEQPMALFMCHQRDDNLCAGWVACHGSNLLALRIATAVTKKIDVAIFNYTTTAPVFVSGTDAAKHGMRDINTPSLEARQLAIKLQRLKEDLL